MILKNYYKLLASMTTNTRFKIVNCEGAEDVVPPTFANGSPNAGMCLAFALDANSHNTYKVSPTMYVVRTSYKGYGGVLFGDGSAPATPDDYKLAGDVITGITASSTVSSAEDDTGVTLSAVHTIINNNADAITIRECGLMAKNATNTDALYSFLVDRTVLDAPVTIPAGGVGQVTYTIRMNYPTA